jgi:hypothetical protein
MSKQVADRAIQVMGGYGYVGEYKVERSGVTPAFGDWWWY